MKSITDMFFEGSSRIYTNGKRVDLVERADKSVVRNEVLPRAVQLIHVLLVPDLPRSSPLDPLLPMLFRCLSLVVD